MSQQSPFSKRKTKKTTLPSPNRRIRRHKWPPGRRRQRLLWVVAGLALISLALVGLFHILQNLRERNALYERAQLSWQKGEHYNAVRGFEQLLANHYLGRRLRQRVLLQAANTYNYYLRNIHRAIELYREVLAAGVKDAEHVEARRALAEVYYREVGDFTQAIEEYTALESEELTDAGRQQAGFTVAELLFKRNEMAKALDGFAEVSRNSADPHLQARADLKIGAIYQLQNNYDAALAPFSRVIDYAQCRECVYQAKLGLAAAHEGREEFDRAIEILDSLGESGEADSFKAREIKRIEEKRDVLQSQITVDWTNRRAQRPQARN